MYTFVLTSSYTLSIGGFFMQNYLQQPQFARPMFYKALPIGCLVFWLQIIVKKCKSFV